MKKLLGFMLLAIMLAAITAIDKTSVLAETNEVEWTLYDKEDGAHLVIGGANDDYEKKGTIDLSKSYVVSSEDIEDCVPWFEYTFVEDSGFYEPKETNIVSVEFDERIAPISISHWFYGCEGLVDVDFSNLDSDNLKDVSFAFYGCSKLEDIGLMKSWDISHIENFESAFENCALLEESNFADWQVSDDAKTKNMFRGCARIEADDEEVDSETNPTDLDEAQGNSGNTLVEDHDETEVETPELEDDREAEAEADSVDAVISEGEDEDTVVEEAVAEEEPVEDIEATSHSETPSAEVGPEVINTGEPVPVNTYGTSLVSETPSDITLGVTRTADPSTMDTFNDFLNIETSSRYAGRVWADKTVFAYGDTPTKDFDGDALQLDTETDGVEQKVESTGDFLHVFSAMGSSQLLDEPTPTDVMLLLDVSGSMGRGEGSNYYFKDDFEKPDSPVPAVKTINAANEAIRKIMTTSPESRVGIAVYGTTAAVLLPLGHYVVDENTDVLKCEYVGWYGSSQSSPQGIHFKVTAHVTERGTNQVKDFVVDNAGQSSDEAHGTKNSSGNRTYPGTGGHTTGSGTLADPYHVGHITNQQAGIACAMSQLASESNTETTWTSLDGTTHSRMPALLHLTDGQASDIAWIQEPAQPGSSDAWARVTNNWYNVDWTYDKAYNTPTTSSGNNHWNANQMSSTAGDVATVTFQTVLTAAYYKQWVNLRYAEGVDPSEAKTLSCYSIYASDTTPYEELTPINRAIVDMNMNPSISFKDYETPADDTYEKYIDTTYELLKRFGNGELVNDTFSTVNTTKTTLNASKAQIANDPHGVKADDLNFGYVDSGDFYHVNFSQLSSIFDTIVGQLMQEAFSPISGESDLKTSDALTYMDPIGDLMDIHTVQGLVLFGSYYPVMPAAVYDYSFMQGRSDFQMGWYKGQDPASATWGGTGTELSDGSTIPDPSLAGKTYSSPTDAWKAGWRYRVDNEIASQFVPNFNVGNKHLHTDYTFYRLAIPETARDALHMNAAYDDEVPFIPEGSDHTQFKGVYKLSDIRIWAEDTGEYKDPIAGDPSIETDSSYDEALWVNIPVNALPIRMARIGGSAERGYTYKTNTNAPMGESLPLRIIYSVSVSDAIKNEAGEIDLDKVDAVDENYKSYYLVDTAERESRRALPYGALEFRSNYYNPNNTYDGYVTNNATGDYTFGDPVVSFSPSTENRYYIFQKPLPLYDAGVSYSESEPGPEQVSISDDDAMHSFQETYSKVSTELNPNEWYYMVIDYYEVVDGVCKPTRLAVTRKGSEFGSGLGEGQYGAFVCWYEESTGDTAPYTADAGHGKPAEGTWVAAAAKGGIRTGDLAQSVVSKGGDYEGVYVANNVTRTANNRLLSAIGKNSTAGNVQIDAYLGNDGRLWVMADMPVELPATGGSGVFAIVGTGTAVVASGLAGLVVTQIRREPRHTAHARTRSAYKRRMRQ